MTAITYPRRLHQLAVEAPDRAALTVLHPGGDATTFSRSELDRGACRVARVLERRGVDEESLVVLALPGGFEFIVAAYAAWWLGACVLPLSTKLAPAEQLEMLEAAATSGRKVVTLAEMPSTLPNALDVAEVLTESESESADELTQVGHDRVPQPGKALPSGGSTGRPKIIVDERRWEAIPDVPNAINAMLGKRPEQTSLVLSPVYHALGFGVIFGLFERNHVVLMPKFDAATAVDAIERFRINSLSTVPAHLLRMARVPDIDQRDLSSVESMYHSGAACPEWLKRRWLELIGPEHFFEGYGSTESTGWLIIRGDEWLAHPGSVGRRGITTEVSIRDADGNEVPNGEIGDIYLRWVPAEGDVGSSLQGATFTYWGTDRVPTLSDGFTTVRDLGWLDADGYLYIADRRVDMVITGGVNVYPAEVESALSEHPDIDDVAVIGLPDDEWGRRVHAIVVARQHADDPQPFIDQLGEWARERLSSAKRPKSYEVVTSLDRNDAGKVRRNQLTRDREAQPPQALTPGGQGQGR